MNLFMDVEWVPTFKYINGHRIDIRTAIARWDRRDFSPRSFQYLTWYSKSVCVGIKESTKLKVVSWLVCFSLLDQAKLTTKDWIYIQNMIIINDS